MGSRATAVLSLHGGRAPRWLFEWMVALGGCIARDYHRAVYHYGCVSLCCSLSRGKVFLVASVVWLGFHGLTVDLSLPLLFFFLRKC